MAILHKRKNSAAYSWQSSDLASGQIGLNLSDGTLHIKNSSGAIKTIGNKAGVIAGTVNVSNQLVVNIENMDVCRFTLDKNASAIGHDINGRIPGARIIFEFIQDATGSRTVNFNSTDFKFGTDITSITLSTAPNTIDRVGCIVGTDYKLHVIAVAKGY